VDRNRGIDPECLTVAGLAKDLEPSYFKDNSRDILLIHHSPLARELRASVARRPVAQYIFGIYQYLPLA
jgi:hypothetical protein